MTAPPSRLRAWFALVVRHRAVVLLAVAIVTALAAASLSRAVLASSVGRLFLGDSPEYLSYVEDRDRFGTDELILFALPIPQPLAQGARERLQRISERLLDHPDVGEVTTLLEFEQIRRTDGGLAVRTYAEAAEDEPDRVTALLEEVAGDPLFGGLLVPRDRSATIVLVGLESDKDRPAEDGPGIVADLKRVLADEGIGEVRSAGWLATITTILEQSLLNITVLLPITGVVLLVVVWLMFRRLWPAALSMVVAVLATLWTMGFAVQIDREINILMAAVPAIVLIVAFSDTVHLCSAYLLELGAGASKDEAILRSAEDVGFACLWTSLTTFVGFVSLSLIPTPVFRQMGVVLGFSVGVALLLAMTLAPVLFSLLPEPKPLREGATSAVHAVLDAGLRWCARVAVAHPRRVVAAFAVVTVVAAVGATRLHVDTDFEGRMDADHPLRQDDAWFTAQLSGSTMVELTVETDAPGGLLEPDVFAAIARLQARLLEDPAVDHAVSYVDLVTRVHGTLQPGAGAPTTRRSIAQNMLLFEIDGGESLAGMIDVERKRARISLRLNERGVRAAAAVGHRGRDLGRELLGDGVSVEPTGLTYLLGDWLDEIVTGQQLSVALSILMIGLMMIPATGSVRVGLVSMYPNVLPLLVMAGYIGFAWDAMDSDTLIIGIMAIGIGVDDTIHFLVRYRLEAARCATTEEAIERTFHFAGRAIAMTTIILVAGFLPFAASDYLTIDIFGKLLPMALIVALLADVLLVPALVELGPLRLTSER